MPGSVAGRGEGVVAQLAWENVGMLKETGAVRVEVDRGLSAQMEPLPPVDGLRQSSPLAPFTAGSGDQHPFGVSVF